MVQGLVSFKLHPSPGTVLSTNVIGEWVDFTLDSEGVTSRKVPVVPLGTNELRSLGGLSVPGDRKYNIPALSPLLIKELDVSEGTGLKIKMRDVKIFGLLGASVEKLK